MNNNHFYKSSNLIFVYLGLFCRHPYDDYYGSCYESDRFVFKFFRSYTLMLSLCNNLLLFQINFECQSNLLYRNYHPAYTSQRHRDERYDRRE